MKQITLIDVNGKLVVVNDIEIYEALREMKLFGMEMAEILAIKYFYDSLGGKMPISQLSVKELIEKVNQTSKTH